MQIIPGGAAANTKKLRMGDRILFVNGVDIRGASHQDAVLALLSKKDSMQMKVQHDPLPSGFRVSSCLCSMESEYSNLKVLLCK